MFECSIGSRALNGLCRRICTIIRQKFTIDYSKKCVKTLHLGQEIFFKETKKKKYLQQKQVTEQGRVGGEVGGYFGVFIGLVKCKKVEN